MLARWLTVLETYDYTIQYRKGSLHSYADTMSCIPARKRKCNRESCLDCSNTLQVKGSDLPNSKLVDKIHVLPVVHSCIDCNDSNFTCKCNIIQSETMKNNSKKDKRSSSVVHPAWIKNWKDEEIADFQKQDKDISIIYTLKREFDHKPKKTLIVQYSMNVRTLWSVWESIYFQNDVLYRTSTGGPRLTLPEFLRA